MSTPLRRWGWLVAAVATAGLGTWFWRVPPPAVGQAAPPLSPAQVVGTWFNARPQTAVVEASARAASTPGEAKPFNPLDTTVLPTFRASPQGKLVVDEPTRNDVERMLALHGNEPGRAHLTQAAADLPTAAQQELRDLFQRYEQYSQAVTQAIPPNQGTLDEASAQLRILHGLREQYFGSEQAQAMFGAEERTAGELLELMRQQTDPKAPLDERAAQAQELWHQAHPAPPGAPPRP